MNDAWMHRITANAQALSGAINGDGLGHLPHSTLGGTIGQQMRRPDQAGDGRHVDDSAAPGAAFFAATLRHGRDAVFTAQKDAFNIDGLHRAPLFHFRLGQGLIVFRSQDPGVVDQDVRAAVTGGHRLHQTLPARLVPHIVPHKGRIAAQGIGSDLAAFLIEFGDNDFCPFFNQPRRRRPSNARTAARDNGDFSVHASHSKYSYPFSK